MKHKNHKDANNAMPMVGKIENPTRITVNKSQAGDVSIGQSVSITVEGEVQGIRKDYVDGAKYEIELKDSEVTDITTSKADKALDEMMGKK